MEVIEEMSLLKLGEVFKITSGGTPSRDIVEYYKDGSIPWIKTGDLKQKYIEEGSEYITELALGKSSTKIFPIGTVLIAMYGATIGATSILNIEAATNQACAAFLPTDKVFPKYLYYFFKANKNNIINMGVGGSQPNISRSILREIKFPLVNLDRQKKIINSLDQVQSLIDKRRFQIEALDELVKSRFIQMFGEPVPNTNAWEKLICKDITSKIGSGATPKGGNSSYKEEGISLIRSMNVHNNQFINKDLAFIDDEQAHKLDNAIVETNDILLNITGTSVARSCIVPNEVLPARVNQHVAIIRGESNKIIPIFLVHQLTSASYQKLLWNIATSGGATRDAITKQQLENLELIVPPLELQNQFADFVKQVYKLKLEMEESLKELEKTFDSLMQRAFNFNTNDKFEI